MASSGRAPRIAFLAGSLGKGGAEKQFYYLVRALTNAGVEIRVFCLTKGEHYETSLANLGVPPVHVGARPQRALRLVALTWGLLAFRPDLVQSVHFFCNLYVGLAAPIAGARSVGSVRGDVHEDLRELGILGIPSLRAPGKIIVNSECARLNAITKGVRPENLSVLHNVLDIAEFDRAAVAPVVEGDGTHGCTIIFVGSLVPVKRVDRLIRAYSAARTSVPGLRVVIVGDGPERERLEGLARRLGHSPKEVQFLGQRHDVPSLLAGADIFVLPSDSEGFPNVLLEAMAARLPVVATDVGDSAVVIRDGVHGFIVPRNDEALLVRRIEDLANSPDLRRQMGGAGRERIERHYSIQHLLPALSTCYGLRLNGAVHRQCAE